MNISGFACQGIKRIYHTARVLHHSLKPAPNQINRQNRKYIHKNYYLPEAGHYIVPILVKPLYTIICKLIQVLVLPLYIKTVIGSFLINFFSASGGCYAHGGNLSWIWTTRKSVVLHVRTSIAALIPVQIRLMSKATQNHRTLRSLITCTPQHKGV